MNKIGLISSGQPSANPRLVKEAVALSESGYSVTVIYIPISPWADKLDEQLIRKYPHIKFVQAGYHPDRQKRGYLWARARRRLLSFALKYTGDIMNIADFSTILFGQELLKVARRHKADLYIAHNLGALPVAVKAAKIHGAKVGFDAEDFHRGEFNDNSRERQQATYLEQKYFPCLDYLSVASPLIGEAYQVLFPQTNPVVLNNVFSVKYMKQQYSVRKSSTLKLFWFSQTIGINRGLENTIKAMGLLSDVSISLTLLGNITPEMEDYFIDVACAASVKPDQIVFLPPVSEDEIFMLASKHDIGFGSEVNHCLNREYCLTNKIFTYLLAGNALVLSDTQAQKKFMLDYPSIGSLYRNEDPVDLACILRRYTENPDLLTLHQRNARGIALKELNWEVESMKFLNIVEKVLAK